MAATSKECPKEQASHAARGGTGTHTGTVGKSGSGRIDGHSTTTGWQPTCTCNADTVHQTVLDPFGGSGTTAQVAKRLGRDFVIIELNPKYVKDLIEPSLENINPLFRTVLTAVKEEAR